MVKTAAAELHTQIEEVRREAFAAGYAAAMKAIHESASRPARTSMSTAPVSNGPGTRRPGRSASAAKPNGSRRALVSGSTKTTRRSAAPKSQRGANALRVEEILKAVSPRAVRPASIRKALQEKGVTISFPSLRYALHQLAARNVASQVGNSRTWRYGGSRSRAPG
jgi:hypothetical protein